MTKRSFFDRLAGSSASDDALDAFDEDLLPVAPNHKDAKAAKNHRAVQNDEDVPSGQLPIDVHQTANDIVIRAFVAGVRPDELNISISRDMVEIEGSRMEREQISGPDYFTQELFWGSFSRVIALPQEIDVEAASASAKDGLLTIILPKLDKAKQTKLRVKSG